nr:uncharacterized protein LOC109180036 [Ipomoea trifida]
MVAGKEKVVGETCKHMTVEVMVKAVEETCIHMVGEVIAQVAVETYTHREVVETEKVAEEICIDTQEEAVVKNTNN